MISFDKFSAWSQDPSTVKILFALLGIIVIYVLSRLAQKSTLRFIKESQNKYYVSKFFHFGSILLPLLFLVILYSDKLQGLSVAFGVAGAGIAFALQEVIMSVAGWAAIAFGNYYRTGDRVQLGGIRGDVIDIGILRTTIMECGEWVNADLYTGRVVRVANSFVFKAPVFNYSGDFPFLWDEIKIPVKFGSDHSLARKILQSTAEKTVAEYSKEAKINWNYMLDNYRIENANIDPVVTMIFNDNWIEFTLRYVVDYKHRRSTKDLLFTSILEEFSQHKDKLALASTTVEIVGLPTINISKEL